MYKPPYYTPIFNKTNNDKALAELYNYSLVARQHIDLIRVASRMVRKYTLRKL